MPHMVLEYTENLAPIEIETLLVDLHTALANADFTDPERIKTRAIPLKQYLVGSKGKSGQMVHVTLSVMTGRQPEQLHDVGKLLFEKLHAALAKQGKSCPVTLEVREMQSNAYFR